MEPKELLRVKEFARRGDMSVARAYRGIHAREVPVVRVCGMLRVPAAYLEKLVREAMTDGVVAGE